MFNFALFYPFESQKCMEAYFGIFCYKVIFEHFTLNTAVGRILFIKAFIGFVNIIAQMDFFSEMSSTNHS